MKIFSLLSLLFVQLAFCQVPYTDPSTTEIPGQWLVQLRNESSWPATLQSLRNKGIEVESHRRLIQDFPVYLLNVAEVSGVQIRRVLDANPNILFAQPDHLVEQRSLPNDPELTNQWHIQNTGQVGSTVYDLNIDTAWDISTGGVTFLGDSIVVAVLDGSFDVAHEDLVDQYWRNLAEIPNDGIDNDSNGYIDDTLGFNFISQTNALSSNSSHGTQVCGALGAKGNNDTGISGVNWDVGILPLVSSAQESNVVEAYGYVLRLRKLYNATQGEQGAFIVATNASFGIDFANPLDFPIWCSMYDSLGTAGILNFGAGPNVEIDIDIEGDVPSGCFSEYLVGVTNIRANGEKSLSAGFGLVGMDLGAPGSLIYMTSNGNTYGSSSGTSFATPITAGAAALLYSAPCSFLAEMAQEHPGQAALYLKDQLLNTVETSVPLQSILNSGGRLDVGNAMISTMDQCSDCLLALDTFSLEVVQDSFLLSWGWQDSTELDSIVTEYKTAVDEPWTTVQVDVQDTLWHLAIEDCSDYQFRVRYLCDSIWISSEILFYRTGNCCFAISDWTAEVTEDNSIEVSAELPPESQGLVFLFAENNGAMEWDTLFAQGNTGVFAGLDDCIEYLVGYQSICPTGALSPLVSEVVLSKGCGACIDNDYCSPELFSNSAWHITETQISRGSILLYTHSSAQELYSLTSDPDILSLEQGKNYTVDVSMSNATSFPLSSMALSVFIDINEDGDFQIGERLYTSSSLTNPVSATIQLPSSQESRSARMRIVLSSAGAGDPCQGFPNESFKAGEIEDFCLELTPGDISLDEVQREDVFVHPIPSSGEIQVQGLAKDEIRSIAVFDALGQKFEALSFTGSSIRVPSSLSGVFILEISTKSGKVYRLRGMEL